MLKDKVILLNQNREQKRIIDQDIALLLKLIVIDGETDIKKIRSKMVINQKQIEKHLNNKEFLLNYLDEQEYNEYLEYYNKLTNFSYEKKMKIKQKINIEENRKQKQIEKENLIKNLISDIINTRLSKETVLIRNCISDTTYDKIISNDELLDSMFGQGFSQILRNRIKQNSIVRLSVPRNMYLIEEREELNITRDDVTYLDEYNNKRLKIICSYFKNNCDIDLVAIEKNLFPVSIVNSILDKKNKGYLKPEFYALIQKLGTLEKINVTGELPERKKIVNTIVTSLENNNYDIDTVSKELEIPIPILKKFLKQPFITTTYSQDQINKIHNIVYSEESIKSKGM